MNVEALIAKRMSGIDASGIRRVFDLGAKLTDPINLSIGQPDFPVPKPIRDAAHEAIDAGRNGYTVTQGVPPLRAKVADHLRRDIGWDVDLANTGDGPSLLVTSGTSGAILLAMMAILDPGDEVIIPDPYFVMYPHVATMCDAHAVRCDTYPDFKLTAERVEPLITPRTKAVLLNSPGNPSGVVMTSAECRDLLELCRSRNVLLISDEIYDEFTFSESRTEAAPDAALGGRCPSPCRARGSEDTVLLVRGFGKTYGVTGWRLGYAAGPKPIIDQIAKLQQYTFVCAPSIAQWGVTAAFEVDMTPHLTEYEARRDLVVQTLSPHAKVAVPGGAFYAFVEVPERLGITATQFVDRCIERSVLVIPGNVFSARDTHFRLSFATERTQLERGLAVLADLLKA